MKREATSLVEQWCAYVGSTYSYIGLIYLCICLFVCLFVYHFVVFFFFQNFISNIKLIIIFTLQKYQNDPSVANTFIYSTLWYKGKYIIIVKKAPMQ